MNIKSQRTKLAARILSALLAFLMVFSLFIETGIAAQVSGEADELEAVCGYIEHEHSADCYVVSGGKYLSCDYNKGIAIHQHNKDCYIDGNLVCHITPIEYHKHDDNCRSIEQRVTCGKEDGALHIHRDECFIDGDLFNTYLEAAKEHVHDTSCYEQRLSCNIEDVNHIHTKSSGCFINTLTCGYDSFLSNYNGVSFEDGNKYLTCGLKAGDVEHIHTSDCYREFVVTCEKIDSSAYPVHQHTSTCYSDTAVSLVPVCGLDEHYHVDLCYPKVAPVEESIMVNFHDMDWDSSEREKLAVNLIKEENKTFIDWFLGTPEPNGEDIILEDILVPQSDAPEAAIASALEDDIKYTKKGKRNCLIV